MSHSDIIKKACVLGYPIAHSLSPKLHGYWLNELNINGSYTKIATNAGELENQLTILKSDGFKGCNLTLPLKEIALPLMDKLTDTAKMIGAVNTVTISSDGFMQGDNSDAFGFIENLKHTIPHWNGAGKTALIFGAGGACRSILTALIQDNISHIYIANRTFETAQNLAQEFSGKIVNPLTKLEAIEWNMIADIIREADLIVNSTSLGMLSKPPLNVELPQSADRETIIYDIVYNPLMTDFLKAGQENGYHIVTGLGMLLYQGIVGFEKWFGVRPKVTQQLEKHMQDLIT